MKHAINMKYHNILPARRLATSGLRIVTLALTLLLMSTGAAVAGGQYASNGMTKATPGAVYLQYIKVLENAHSLQEIFPFSPNPMARNMQDLKRLSPKQRQQALAGIKAMSIKPKGAKVLSQKITGDAATLEISGMSPSMMDGKPEPTWATVKMVRRGGEWKVAKQSLRDTKKVSKH